jgi:hypothetical protein
MARTACVWSYELSADGKLLAAVETRPRSSRRWWYRVERIRSDWGHGRPAPSEFPESS